MRISVYTQLGISVSIIVIGDFMIWKRMKIIKKKTLDRNGPGMEPCGTPFI